MYFDVNVKSVFLGNAAVMPILIKQNEGGAMINVASIGATRPRPGIAWYNASKEAVYNVGLLCSRLPEFFCDDQSIYRANLMVFLTGRERDQRFGS